jgi:hypothetical protein
MNSLHTSQQKDLANSPLAQFFNSNNFNNASPRPAPVVENKQQNKDMNGGQKLSAPPGFKAQSQKNLLMSTNKETKLITPTMFAPSSNNNNNENKKPSLAEPLTKNQLVQALNYLIENDDDFMRKVHEAYIKSFKSKS